MPNDVILKIKLQKEEFAKFWSEHAKCRLRGRNHIISSLCPQVYGLYVVKLAVALVMAGGVRVRVCLATNVCGFFNV